MSTAKTKLRVPTPAEIGDAINRKHVLRFQVEAMTVGPNRENITALLDRASMQAVLKVITGLRPHLASESFVPGGHAQAGPEVLLPLIPAELLAEGELSFERRRTEDLDADFHSAESRLLAAAKILLSNPNTNVTDLVKAGIGDAREIDGVRKALSVLAAAGNKVQLLVAEEPGEAAQAMHTPPAAALHPVAQPTRPKSVFVSGKVTAIFPSLSCVMIDFSYMVVVEKVAQYKEGQDFGASVDLIDDWWRLQKCALSQQTDLALTHVSQKSADN